VQTGWWFKLREENPPYMQKVPGKSLKNAGAGGKLRRRHKVVQCVLDFYSPGHKLAWDAERQAWLELFEHRTPDLQ